MKGGYRGFVLLQSLGEVRLTVDLGQFVSVPFSRLELGLRDAQELVREVDLLDIAKARGAEQFRVLPTPGGHVMRAAASGTTVIFI